MKLYKINIVHYAPKDSETGIKCLLIADTDEDVYNWISGNISNAIGIYCGWQDDDDDESEKEYYIGDDYDNSVSKKEAIIALKGDDDESIRNYEDLYYGDSRYTWECIAEEVSDAEIEVIKRLLLPVHIINQEDNGNQ